MLFDEETPLSLIQAFKPEILVKGGDYTPATVVGHDIVEKNGGKTVIIPDSSDNDRPLVRIASKSRNAAMMPSPVVW